MSPALVVRAIDVGYGHVKFTDGYSDDGTLCVDSFPSQSPVSSGAQLKSVSMQQRDTFLVPVGKHAFEVGKGVAGALRAHQETAVLDSKFALSDAYAARLLGALNYMAPALPTNAIDFLKLGLPMTTYVDLSEKLAKRFTGELIINLRGDVVTVRDCEVFPQPFGGYASFLAAKQFSTPPRVLVIDPGYNTMDWFVCRGMEASELLCSATTLGMSAVMKDAAARIIKTIDTDAHVSAVVRLIDRTLMTDIPLSVCGIPVDLNEFLSASSAIIDEAVQAVKNSIGSGEDIDAIVLTGGGALFYSDAIRKHFTQPVTILTDSTYANVRGFQALGEAQAESAWRATTKGRC